MGIDLTLYPMGEFMPITGQEWLAHSRLSLARDYLLHDAIRDLQSREVPAPAIGHFGDFYVKRNDDCYGKPLRYVLAKEFRKIEYTASLAPWNKWVIEALKLLPDETPVILFWS